MMSDRGCRVPEIVQVIALLLLLGGCQGLRMPNSYELDEGAWPVSGGEVQRSNAADQSLAPPLSLIWTYNAEAGFGSASPLISSGYVLVGTRKGDVHAIRLEDGKRLGYVSVGESVEGAAALGAHAFIGAAADGKRPLFRYDLRAGEMAWRVASEPILAGVLPDAEYLVVADSEGGVASYDVQTGERRWTYQTKRPVTFRAAPVATPAGIFVADDRGGQYLLDRATGTPLWTREGADPVYSTPAASGDTLYVSTTRGELQVLNAQIGNVLWHLALQDTTVRLSAPAILDGDVVLGGTDGVVRLLDAATGVERWTATTDGAIVAPPLLTRDVVYVGTMARKLLAFSRKDGTVLWEYELRGRMKSGMALADGSLIVLSEPRYVYRFAPAEP